MLQKLSAKHMDRQSKV